MAKRGDIDVLLHGCNCFNTMGNGIAKTIKREFPEIDFILVKWGKI